MSTQNQATRTEKDTMGNVEVPADAYWGAQTQRSRENFKIGGETLPRPMIEAMAEQLGLTQDDMDTFFIDASKL